MKNILMLVTLTFTLLLFSCNVGTKSKATKLAKGDTIEMEWGNCSLSEIEGSSCLLLNVMNWPKETVLNVSGLNTRVVDIYLKSNPKHHLAWRIYEGDLQIHVSSINKTENDVIVVKTKGSVIFEDPSKKNG